MPDVRFYYNATCVKCDACDRMMIRIGAFIMCEPCCMKEFEGLSYDPKSPKYREWLKKYNEKYK